MNDALHQILDEREVLSLGCRGSTGDGFPQPLGAVTGHLMAANLQHRTITYEAYHGFERDIWSAIITVIEEAIIGLFGEELALVRVSGRAPFEGLNFTDEFTNILKLAVNRNVAHICHGVDVVKLGHHAGANTA